jgi:uncharacterized membrane protein YfcA
MEIVAIFISGLVAGYFGALVGLGGGVVMVPLLNLIFGLPIKTAVATSLCAVCATSIGGTARYLKSELVNIRMGLFLEMTTVIGAVGGGLIALIIKPQIVSVAFAIVLLYTSLNMLAKLNEKDIPLAAGGSYEVSSHRKFSALGLSSIAGMVSALLGVGGGVVQVPILHLILRYPIKAAVATSTFMIGITAASGTLVYFIAQLREAVDYLLIDYYALPPLIIGTLIGSNLGALTASKIKSRIIKIIFVIALLYAGVRIGLRGLGLELF